MDSSAEQLLSLLKMFMASAPHISVVTVMNYFVAGWFSNGLRPLHWGETCFPLLLPWAFFNRLDCRDDNTLCSSCFSFSSDIMLEIENLKSCKGMTAWAGAGGTERQTELWEGQKQRKAGEGRDIKKIVSVYLMVLYGSLMSSDGQDDWQRVWPLVTVHHLCAPSSWRPTQWDVCYGEVNH